jgi:hypothetical protein
MLNEKRKAFISKCPKDQNATQVATRAGYSPKTAYSQGPSLLKDAEEYCKQPQQDQPSVASWPCMLEHSVLKISAPTVWTECARVLCTPHWQPLSNKSGSPPISQLFSQIAEFKPAFDHQSKVQHVDYPIPVNVGRLRVKPSRPGAKNSDAICSFYGRLIEQLAGKGQR